MANPVEFTVETAVLPSTFEGTLADFVALLPTLLTVRPDQEWTSFVVGTTMPTSNVGPWLKVTATGGEWWVWSTTDSTYVPLTVALPTIPDASISGSVLTDHSVTEAKLSTEYVARVDSAISAIQTTIANGVGRLAVAEKNVAQSYSYSTSPTPMKVSFGSELVDVAGRYDPINSRYTADESGWYWVNATVYTGTVSESAPVGVGTELVATVNGTSEILVNAHVSGADPIAGRTHTLQGVVHLTSGQYVEVFFYGGLASGALTVLLVNDNRKSRLQIWKVA